jgi:hypothetical protein
MDNKPYEEPFHWRYEQLFIAVIIITIIIMLIILSQGPTNVGIQSNLIRDL